MNSITHDALSSISALDMAALPTRQAAALSSVRAPRIVPHWNIGKPAPWAGRDTPGKYRGAPF